MIRVLKWFIFSPFSKQNILVYLYCSTINVQEKTRYDIWQAGLWYGTGCVSPGHTRSVDHFHILLKYPRPFPTLQFFVLFLPRGCCRAVPQFSHSLPSSLHKYFSVFHFSSLLHVFSPLTFLCFSFSYHYIGPFDLNQMISVDIQMPEQFCYFVFDSSLCSVLVSLVTSMSFASLFTIYYFYSYY